jgi:hypothetical protein
VEVVTVVVTGVVAVAVGVGVTVAVGVVTTGVPVAAGPPMTVAPTIKVPEVRSTNRTATRPPGRATTEAASGRVFAIMNPDPVYQR